MLLRTVYLSLDPYMRGRMSDAPSYAPPVELGAVMVGGTVSRVEASNHPGFKVGDWVLSANGWQDYALSDGSGLARLGESPEHPSYALGLLGMPGFTAYMGLLDIGKPQAGETLVVAAATGPVGATVGQIGKLKGCRVVGVAGGAEKCRHAVQVLGFDACLDHHAADFAERLAEACPDGIDIYYENVGGKVFDAVFPLLNAKARIPVCGIVAHYNDTELPPGPDRLPALMGTILRKRIKVQGFIIFDDYGHRYDEFQRDMSKWFADGLIQYREERVDGLENAPRPSSACSRDAISASWWCASEPTHEPGGPCGSAVAGARGQGGGGRAAAAGLRAAVAGRGRLPVLCPAPEPRRGRALRLRRALGRPRRHRAAPTDAALQGDGRCRRRSPGGPPGVPPRGTASGQPVSGRSGTYKTPRGVKRMKVGFLGLGGMGAAMATRLVQAGLEVTVWNRSAAACEPLVALGAARAEEVGELFGLDVVISMLADDQAIRGVLLDSGALERARPGLIHLSMSTLSLDCVEALDQAHQRQGLAFVAAPVFGRTDVAEAGKLNIVVGGPEEAIEQVKALLEIMGQKTWFFGKDPRGAMAVKISGNFMIASAIESMGESVALVKRLGVEPGRFMELMSSTLFDAPVYRNYGPQIVEQRFTPARFRLVLGLKDVDLALSAGKRHNVPLPLASLLHDVLLEAIAHGDGESDWTALAKVALSRSGQI